MKAIPLTKKTREVAEKLVWFESPEKALSDPVRFMAYAFARATHEDTKVLRTYIGDADLKDALDQAPPGIIDPRSWSYWNLQVGRYPAPPIPKRHLP